ncbi:TPA: hypothetical protein N0F65_006135, partial [Lagenidium giganteum]
MRTNEGLSIVGEKVTLVPYEAEHVAKYHEWMKDPWLQEATASEPLSLDEEYAMQRSWREDPKKCTFIVLAKAPSDDDGVAFRDAAAIDRMAGDVNLFFNDDEDEHNCEMEIMIAEAKYRRQGLAEEAVRLMMAFATSKLNVTRFYCKIHETNAGSLHLFDKYEYIIRGFFAGMFLLTFANAPGSDTRNATTSQLLRRLNWSFFLRSDDQKSLTTCSRKHGSIKKKHRHPSHWRLEIRQRVHTSHRRITTPHRMSMIILDGQRREQLGSVGMDALSYFPKIHENQTTRDFREQKAKQPSMRLDAMTPESAVGSLAPSLMAELDQDGVLAIREAFRRHRYMCEDDFIVEMLCGLHAESLPREAQVELTAQLSALFRQADLRSQGVLNWSDMCAFIAQSSDEVCTLDDTLINKYSVDMAPCPLNLVSEVKSMFYFAPVDQLLIQEAKHKGFRMYNAKTNRPVLEVNNPHSGPILDAIYSPFGRYIITSSTSPILCFYDADQLRLRQQIPTEGVQTALALPLETTLGSPILFSACASGQVYAWNMETLQLTDTFLSKGSHGHAAITDLVVIDGMSQIACASMDTKIHMIDLHKGSVAKTLSGHKKGISMLRYCNENGYLVSAGVDHSLQVWNPHLEQRVGTLSGHRHQLIGMEVIENSPEIITADESGIVKIWDLRKFSVVQTLVKEQYIRSSESSATGVARRNIARQMNAMCYMATQKRIAIAHSTVYFVDAEQPLQPTEQRHQEAIKPSFTGDEEDGENAVPTDAVKPLLITYNPPSRCIISFSGWDFKCWDIFTGKFIRSVPRSLVGEYTTVCEVEDHYSCFVGTDNGVIARLMIPSGSIVVQRIVHTAEVTTAQYMPARKQVVIGYADGIIVVADNETLEQIHRFHHWRGVQSALHAHSFPATNQEDDGGDGFSYSVPSHLRTFFY